MKDLPQILSDNANENGLPILDGNLFDLVTKEYGKEDFRLAVADYIAENRPPFPFKDISHEKMREKFFALCDYDTSKCITPTENLQEEVMEKYPDYTYDFKQFGLGLIDCASTHGDASNYFHQELRLACGSYGFKPPVKVWQEGNSKDIWRCLGPIWRGINGVQKVQVEGKEELMGGKLDEKSYISAFRLGTYIATQFKPLVAKTIYDNTQSQIILDTSCGWGDRLCGFYAGNHTTHYIGTDPNPNTFVQYKKQCIEYETFLTGREPNIREDEDYFLCVGAKTVVIYRCGAEDLDYESLPPIDCAFTSPPYFSTERYNEGGEHAEDQSWAKFNEYKAWRDEFYLPVAEQSYKALSNHGVLYVNILDPKINGVRYHSGDDLINHIGVDRFQGQIGMRIMQRPQGASKFKHEDGTFDKEALDEFMKKYYIENIWCFSKGESRDFFKDARVSTLDEFFG